MNKSILVIAYVFPPIAYAGTHRTLRLCKYLSRLGYELHVMTIGVQKDLHNDFDLLKKVKDYATIHRTETIDIWRYYNTHKKRFLKRKTGRLIDRILSFFIEILSQPDHMNLWVPFAVRTGRNIVRRHRIDVIYTTSPPHSQLVTGYLLKRMTKLPWVADLRDPIVYNIGSEGWRGYERVVNRLLEKTTANNTDYIVTNTNAAKSDLNLKYRKSAVACIPNSFDEDDFVDLPDEKYQKFTISHLGTVYGFRNSVAFFEAIATLARSGYINPKEFEVRFYGINDNVLFATIDKYKLKKYIKIEPLVKHREALEIMNRSHMLLLLKGFGSSGIGQIPGKLFEYIGSGNPILYIGPEKCEAAEVINQIGNSYIVGKDPTKIKDVIISEYQKNRSAKSCNSNAILRKNDETLKKFSSYGMAQKMSTLIESLTLEN